MSPRRYEKPKRVVLSVVQPAIGEKHYTVPELAKLWNLSEKTIRRMFSNVPGVLKWGAQEQRFRRRYTTLRIPHTVAECVYQSLQSRV